MGSKSDWPTLKHAADVLDELGVRYEARVVSAHRTPERLYEYARTAKTRGLKAIIAGAGGAAHLPGMTASMTALPVLGVPVESRALKGLDSLLSIAQMPGGVPVSAVQSADRGGVCTLDPPVHLVEWQAASQGDGSGGGAGVFDALGSAE